MRPLPRLVLFLLAGGLAAAGLEEARRTITAAEIRAHLTFLSLDDLQGRAPGTRGGQLAGDYIASQFQRMGLQPVDGGYFQPVPLTGITTDATTLGLEFEADAQRLAAHYPGDALIRPGLPEPSVRVAGELVFAGYGADAPVWRWDDFKGRDLTGKVIVFLVGEPAAPPDEPGLFDGRATTYYGLWSYKLEQARRRGATGALVIHSDAAAESWENIETVWAGEQLTLARDDRPEPPLLLQGWLTQDFARRLFALGGMDLDELYVQASRRDFRPIATGITVRSRMNSRSRQLETRNVVGLLPGGDPEQRDELVVLTSHYDHLGTDPGQVGDSVYNGAYDNASGVSVLLEIAEAFTSLDTVPDRSILFMATAANEAGLLGSRYYIQQPLFPLDRTVAALDVHEINVWGETDDVVALGAGRSTLGDLVPLRAEELGLAVVPDPEPEYGSLYRSDPLAFARAGIPILSIKHGVHFRGRPASWGESRLADYRMRHHHRPSDEFDPDFDLSGAVQQGRLIFSLAYDIAMWDRVARWNPGESFGTAGEPMTP